MKVLIETVTNRKGYKNFNDIDSLGKYLRKSRKNIDFLSDEFGMYYTFLQNNYVPNGYLTRMSAQKKKELHVSDVLEDWWTNLQQDI